MNKICQYASFVDSSRLNAGICQSLHSYWLSNNRSLKHASLFPYMQSWHKVNQVKSGLKMAACVDWQDESNGKKTKKNNNIFFKGWRSSGLI